MTHYDVIIFQKIKLKKNPKTNNCKKNFEIPLNSAKDINITRFTCLRFARQVSSPYCPPLFRNKNKNCKSLAFFQPEDFSMKLSIADDPEPGQVQKFKGSSGFL